jgi:hypothetical protein
MSNVSERAMSNVSAAPSFKSACALFSLCVGVWVCGCGWARMAHVNVYKRVAITFIKSKFGSWSACSTQAAGLINLSEKPE